MSKARESSKCLQPNSFSNSCSTRTQLLALRTSPPSFGIAEGERIARDLYGLAVSIGALPGERDCNFRLRTADVPGVDTREFVLKILDVATDAESTDCLVCVL